MKTFGISLHSRKGCWCLVAETFFLIIAQTSPALATEPTTGTFVAFFGGLILGLVVPLILYPILVICDSAKIWTIGVLGIISLLWSGLICSFLDGSIAAIYFCISLLMFIVAYLKKTSKIEKKKLADSSDNANEQGR